MSKIKIKLRIPYFKQRKITCGPSSLQQVLTYYGKKITLDEILKEVKMFKYGTWTSYLGIYAIKHGFNAKRIYYDVNYIDPSWFKLSRDRLIRKLQVALKKEKSKIRKDGIISLLDYLKTNGKIIFQIPSKKLLIDYLRRKIPIIMCLSSTILYKRRRFDLKKDKRSEYGKPVGHFVVIGGYKNGNFIINDPHARYGGVYEVSEDKLIFAWLFWGGDSLIIEPKFKIS